MPKPLLKRGLVAVPTRRVARAQPGRWRRPALVRGEVAGVARRLGAAGWAGAGFQGEGWRARIAATTRPGAVICGLCPVSQRSVCQRGSRSSRAMRGSPWAI